MTTVVLGWDALDPELLSKWGLEDAFGGHVASMDTIVNSVAGEPMTRELWPTMITGVPPSIHGVRAETEGDGIDWNSELIDTASSYAAGVVPDQVRSRVGRWLRNRGAEVQQTDAAELEASDHGTIFTERDGVAISVPNYRTEWDRRLGLSVDRTAIWNGVLETVETAGGTQYEPQVGLRELETRLVGKARRRLGYVEGAVEHEPDIIWCWFGYLDTAGHLAPAIDGPEWHRRQYERAARWTHRLRRETGAVVISVSDHGLQNGTHTHKAAWCGPQAIQPPASVTDVRESVARTIDASDGQADALDDSELAVIERNLEDLGYV